MSHYNVDTYLGTFLDIFEAEEYNELGWLFIEKLLHKLLVLRELVDIHGILFPVYNEKCINNKDTSRRTSFWTPSQP